MIIETTDMKKKTFKPATMLRTQTKIQLTRSFFPSFFLSFSFYLMNNQSEMTTNAPIRSYLYRNFITHFGPHTFHTVFIIIIIINDRSLLNFLPQFGKMNLSLAFIYFAIIDSKLFFPLLLKS